jgi:hypothetical protein
MIFSNLEKKLPKSKNSHYSRLPECNFLKIGEQTYLDVLYHLTLSKTYVAKLWKSYHIYMSYKDIICKILDIDKKKVILRM